MATAEHPSGQWSCISPWETTLISCNHEKNHPEDIVEFLFKRGGQNYVYLAETSGFPYLHYATELADKEMARALEKAAFYHTIRELDPVFARMDRPGHIMRQLPMACRTIDLTANDASGDSCQSWSNTDRILQIPYDNPPKLPLHNWNQFQILETFQGGFKVQARSDTIADAHSKSEVYGCILFNDNELAADGAYLHYLHALDSLNEDAQMGKFHDDDHDVGDGEHFIPRLRAFLRIDDYSASVVGFLFSWTNSSTKASCVRQLSPYDLRDGAGSRLFMKCHDMFQRYKRVGYCIAAKGRGHDILDMIGFTVSGRPFVRLPDLGTYRKTSKRTGNGRLERKFAFFREKSGDKAALEELASFLMGRTTESPRSSFMDKDFKISPPDFSRSNSRNRLEKLPQEVLSIILDYILLRPSVHCTERGFCASPPLDTALFATSTFLRYSALLRFVKNPFVVEYKFLGTFLRHVSGIKVRDYDHLLSNRLQGNGECWTSLQKITLLVSERISTAGSHHALRTKDLWDRSGIALGMLLEKKGKDKEHVETEVQILFLNDPRIDLPSGEMRNLFRSFRPFFELPSVTVKMLLLHGEEGIGRYEYGYHLLRTMSEDQVI